MSNFLQKKNSMPTATTVPPPSQGKSKKNKTLARMFHKNAQSFRDTPLKSEMKQKPSYQSDPNLLADCEVKEIKKTRSWKWPFPKNKNAHELPDQIKGVLYKKSYFPK